MARTVISHLSAGAISMNWSLVPLTTPQRPDTGARHRRRRARLDALSRILRG
jgi:hypothetical protein